MGLQLLAVPLIADLQWRSQHLLSIAIVSDYHVCNYFEVPVFPLDAHMTSVMDKYSVSYSVRDI